MKLTLNNLRLSLSESEEVLLGLCARKLRAPVKYFRILKKSLDARDKGDIRWVYSVECSDEPVREDVPVFEKVTASPRVYIAGTGPAGLFCALRLLDHGVRPVLLERGRPVEERAEAVGRFYRSGVLDPESNVQFGEGGAGTFSDGKLNTQTKTPLNAEVLKLFVKFGAPPEIEYLNKPHIGSDNLRRVIANIRTHILKNGGEVRFSARLSDISMRDGRLDGVFVNGTREEADALVLGIGHSARDTFEMLLGRGLRIEPKPFAVGVRVEHLQSEIGRAQYGNAFRRLPPADYKLVSHAGERAAFTFCMCPGGVVVPAAGEEGGTVTNGMSNYARDGKNANAALIAQVTPEDFGSDHPLSGVAFQRKIERAAFLAAGGEYLAPVQRMEDFLAGRASRAFGDVLPTYARGTAFAPLESYLPPAVVSSLRAAATDMDRRLKGFAAPDALLTGPETRTSSPVRIVRDESLQAAGIEGVYPCGEGCGYAGGIMSAAADGLRVASALARRFMERSF